MSFYIILPIYTIIYGPYQYYLSIFSYLFRAINQGNSVHFKTEEIEGVERKLLKSALSHWMLDAFLFGGPNIPCWHLVHCRYDRMWDLENLK